MQLSERKTHHGPGKPVPCHIASGNSGSARKKSVKFLDLTDKEMAHLRAKGKCFNCKETGHMSCNCPHKNTVAGSGNSKPPGLPSYSIDMTVVIDDDKEAILQAMPVGFIDVGSVSTNACQGSTEPSKSWRSWYPFWQNPRPLAREKMDDCYEMTAEYILTIQQL